MPHFIRRLILAAVTIALGTLAVVSCSSQATYAPAAYGVSGQCYYINSPAEAIALEAAGLCPAGWAPTLAPLYWQEMYYPYYSSPAYYGRYVPATSRTTYISHETVFHTQHAAAITTASKTATYKSSTGKTVKGTQVSTAHFGSGTVTSKVGGGNARSNTGSSGKTGSGGGAVHVSGGSSGHVGHVGGHG